MKRNRFKLSIISFFSFVICYPIAFVSGQQQLCSTQQSFNGTRRVFSKCQPLGTQSASIAWSLDPLTSVLDISFSGQAVSPSGWVGWGLNPSGLQMEGTSALVAFKDSKGKSNMLQYMLTSEVRDGSATLSPSKTTDLIVLDQVLEINGSNFHMFASLQLKKNQTTINLIWNRGPGVSGTSPLEHNLAPVDLQGTKRIDLSSGITSGGGTISHKHLKNTHGLIAAVSWGILLPLGAMAARYLRAFDPLWFYLHITIQSIAYILAVTAWAIGLRLGHYSAGVVYHQHRRIGITLFSFATLQMFAIVLRPNKESKVRRYWNIYHHTIGFTIIILASVNIFKGLAILEPGSGWRKAYIIIISCLGGFSIILEIIVWLMYFYREVKRPNEQSDAGGSDGAIIGAANGQRKRTQA